MSDAVVSRPPPKAVLTVVNPIFKALLRTPLGPRRLVVLHFRGRRTSRRYDIIVGCHEVGGERYVFTPSRWAVNFRGGLPVDVTGRGLDLHGTGTLIEDPAAIAPILQAAVDAASPREYGLVMPPGHRLTPEDVTTVGRKMIRLDLEDPKASRLVSTP